MTGANKHPEFTAMTMAEVALNYPDAVGIFKKHNLDYCFGGERRLVDACDKKGIDPLLVIYEILGTRLAMAFNNKIDFATWNLSLIIDFIVQHHHRYVRTAIPEINDLLERVCNVHGSDYPKILTIREKFILLGEELLSHMEKEEQTLFPFIERLNKKMETAAVGLYIAAMEHEHDSAGALLKSIRSLSGCYTPPVHVDTTYKITFLKMSFFDDDLVQHFHIENKILFPRARRLA